MVRIKLRRNIGRKTQIVIPKIVRESLGIKPGDEVLTEVRDKEVAHAQGKPPSTTSTLINYNSILIDNIRGCISRNNSVDMEKGDFPTSTSPSSNL